MQNQIIVTELNQPSFKALQAFNQAVFNAIQQHYNSQEQESEVQSHE
ncbi:hypothetical protein Ga0466249_004079 [Sporomusaceae bacterium BoRhaA]|nr:hypothetical protein [Pelorhabdus rhamnosifermentans]MBU2702944.1 hypothetical protein [Pelorhabdus rhamnosifermentans]